MSSDDMTRQMYAMMQDLHKKAMGTKEEEKPKEETAQKKASAPRKNFDWVYPEKDEAKPVYAKDIIA